MQIGWMNFIAMIHIISDLLTIEVIWTTKLLFPEGFLADQFIFKAITLEFQKLIDCGKQSLTTLPYVSYYLIIISRILIIDFKMVLT